MILDITWCTGVRCAKANTCYRFTENLRKMAEKRKMDLTGKQISIANFADHEGKCDRYEPEEEKTK